MTLDQLARQTLTRSLYVATVVAALLPRHAIAQRIGWEVTAGVAPAFEGESAGRASSWGPGAGLGAGVARGNWVYEANGSVWSLPQSPPGAGAGGSTDRALLATLSGGVGRSVWRTRRWRLVAVGSLISTWRPAVRSRDPLTGARGAWASDGSFIGISAAATARACIGERQALCTDVAAVRRLGISDASGGGRIYPTVQLRLRTGF